MAGSGPDRVHHPWFARMYLRMDRNREARGEDEHRRRLLRGLSGSVVEVGAGNGLNFRHYPGEVTRVLAIEPEPLLRSAALEAAAAAPAPIEVVDGLAEEVPAADGEFDAAVASLMLCSVKEQAVVLAELSRVLRPGGALRFYEHVASSAPLARRLQRIADATVWPRLAGGCHLARDTEAAIERAGFEITEIDRFRFSPGPGFTDMPHVLGSARRP